MAQWVRAFALQAKGWVFESQPRQTLDPVLQLVLHTKEPHSQWPLVPSKGQNLQPFTGSGNVSK